MAHRQSALAAFTGTALLAAALVPAPAHPQDRNWYIGASTDNTHVEVYRGYGWEVGGSQRGLSLRGGWRFHRNFELELAGLRAADLYWSEYLGAAAIAAHTSFDVTALTASAVGKVHWGQTFEGYLKAGLAEYQVDGVQVLDTLRTRGAQTRDVEASGADYLLGIGLAIKASPKWRVRVEYQYFGVDRDFLGVNAGGDPSIDTFSVGLDYQLMPR